MEFEGYPVFITQAPHVGAAIKQGSVILKSLFDDAKPRLEKLIAWSKSFKPDTDLNLKDIKGCWQKLLPFESG